MNHVHCITRKPSLAQDMTLSEKLALYSQVLQGVVTILTTIASTLALKDNTGA